VVQQPAAMFKVLRTDPPIPDNLSPEGKDFLRCCFKRKPVERPAASKLLEHPFIQNPNHQKNQHGSVHSFAAIKSPVRFFAHFFTCQCACSVQNLNLMHAYKFWLVDGRILGTMASVIKFPGRMIHA
jgi:serine/threonine protein kinase